MKHDVSEAQLLRTCQTPFEPLDSFHSSRRIPEAASLFDGLRRRVIFAWKPQHRPAHSEVCRLRGRWHCISFSPGGVVGIPAGDLNNVNSETVEKSFQLR